MKTADILLAIEQWAPFAQIMEPDNVGLLVGDPEAEISRILCCLDITHGAVEQAKSLGCELIVSHHPVIFRPLSALKAGTAPYRLAREGIGAICAHTNLDCAAGGVNDALAARLGLSDVRPFGLSDGSDPAPLGRIGNLPRALGTAEFAAQMAALFGPVRVTERGPEAGRKSDTDSIRKVAVCGGSGGDWLYPAAALDADAFVTGELRHHEHLDAVSLGVAAVEAGHFATEEHIRGVLADYLKRRFPEAEVFRSEEKPPYRTVFPGTEEKA